LLTGILILGIMRYRLSPDGSEISAEGQMSLEEDLKAKTLALISQQMANWVVEIQRHIGAHQENLVRSLDELQETVARYDEKISEPDIEAAMVEVVASQPPAAPVGPSYAQLKASLAEIEKGSSLSEVLTHLVNETSHYVERSVMFIVKGASAIGWYARGVEPSDVVKQINVPLNTETAFRNVQNAKRALRGHIAHSPGTAQALARLGGNPQGILLVPLILRDKLAAILYCDTSQDEVPSAEADLIEILVVFSSKSIDILSAIPKSPPPVARTTSGTTVERAAAIRAGGDEVRERVGVPPRPAAPPPPPPHPVADEGSSTVMFSAVSIPGARPQPPPPPPSRPVPVAPLGPLPSPEEQKAHEDARRFARLVVSEIKLYNEAKVNEGRRQRNIYEKLKEDIERGRQMYSDRVPPPIRETSNYFFDELVRILAGGDAGALGPM
jgi:hypothetical protein